MIDIKDKKDCCGCSACVQRCPKKCIVMQADNEGFLYPVVNRAECIDCSLCEKVCPIINKSQPPKAVEVYAATNTDKTTREQSSSGGIFTLLAQSTIDKGGIVYGVRYNEDWIPVFGSAETREEIAPLRGSKYAQAIVGDTYKEIENLLKGGREVLFCGTPCQVVGLKRFLRKEYDNLLLVDIICHGVPSPLVLRKYLDETFNGPKDIKNLSMRDKSISWKQYNFTVTMKDGTIFSQRASTVHFIKGFIGDLYLRPSCHSCPAKRGSSESDITIADFWGIEKVTQEFNDDKGCSAIIINSNKGSEILESIECNSIKLSIDPIIHYNSAYCKSSKAHPNRSKFFKYLEKGVDVKTAIDKSLSTPIYKKVTKKLKNIAKRVLKNRML